ncbi:MAG TPA: nitroreductase family protein [Candidatus Binataceae bacterium]|nr:nitroreductase family protein [Candidatus Binataceae bacterium]
MDTIEAILSRKVQRAFSTRAVESEKLGRIVDAGRHAMSARNLQPWQFIVVTDRERLKVIGALCSTGRFVADAPSAIVILKDLSNTRWADIDCAQAVQNMATAAWSLGLGTCWVGNFDSEKLSEILGVPDGWGIFTILPFGYASDSNPPQARPLKSRREIVHFEKYGATRSS